MKCPKCQIKNPVNARFCSSCDHQLELACLECEKVNPFGSRFCNSHGKELDQVPEEKKVSESEGECKYVTVLFSDLSGYTTMSGKLDSEEVKEIMRRVFGQITRL